MDQETAHRETAGQKTMDQKTMDVRAMGRPARHSPRLCGLAANPALPTDLLDQFIARADAELCLDLADRDDLSPAQIRRLADRGSPDSVVRLVRRRLLTAADVDPADPGVALAVLDEKVVPEAWTRSLLAHPDPAVRAGLAEARHVPPDVLAALADDPAVEVVEAVAGSDRLTAALAWRVARHPHLAVPRAVAANEVTPPNLLAALGTDGTLSPARFCFGCDGTAEPPPGNHCHGGHEDASVGLRYAIATNPATPPDTVVGQAENPAIGERLIRALAGDDHPEVRRRLAHNPAVPLDVLADIAPRTRIGSTLLLRLATATPDEVETLARSPIAALRMLLAERPDLPPAVVNRLATDSDAKVLNALAPNPALGETQLREMVARHGSRVLVRVASNPACGPALLHDLATHVPPVPKALRAITAHANASADSLLWCLRDQRARRVAAGHPALPAAAIQALVDDPDDQVAEAAAANPSLPYAAMAGLLVGG